MPMPKRTFAKAVQEILLVSAGHGALFLFGPGLVLPAQQGLKLPGHCGALLHEYYNATITAGVLFVFATFGSYLACNIVKERLPEAADGGLQGLAARDRFVLRAIATLGLLLSIAASLLAFSVFGFFILTKFGRPSCLPGHVRGGLFSFYAIVGGLLAGIYVSDARAILLSQE